MTKEELKNLTDDALKEVYKTMQLKTQNQLKDNTKVDFKDISDLYAIQDEIRLRGMILQDDKIVEKRIKNRMTREDRAIMVEEKKRETREKDNKYIIVGISLFVLGLALTITNNRYIFTGIMGIGIAYFILGIYRRSSN
jgi:hypothetical protein